MRSYSIYGCYMCTSYMKRSANIFYPLRMAPERPVRACIHYGKCLAQMTEQGTWMHDT